MSDWIKKAKVGDRVVCINDEWDWTASCDGYSIPTRLPMINEVLTISEILSPEQSGLRSRVVGLIFEEIEKRQSDGPLSAVINFAFYCFSPIIDRPTSISIFTDMLKTEPVKEDA